MDDVFLKAVGHSHCENFVPVTENAV